MRACRVVLALLALGGSSARADPPASSGPFFAVRASYGIPYGDIARAGPPGPRVEDVVERKLPLGIEVGYRFNRYVWAELAFDIAPAWAAAALCANGTPCSASDARLGLAALFRLAPKARLDPWIGIGVAVEVMNAEGLNPGVSPPSRYEWSWFGFEAPFAEVGIDISISDRIAVGPFVTGTVARFTSESQQPEGGSTSSGAIKDRTTHGWLSAGLKVTLKL